MKETFRLASPAPVEIPAVPPGVRLTTLENGLTLILREDHSAPVVSAQAWCRSGSIHEGRWLGAGLSHMLEHMLFKGTATRPGGKIDQEIQDAGGQMNAYTSFDRTVYWINVPNTGARIAIDVLCDIMQHATLPEADLAKEMDVIRREMDMNQDDPGRRAGRRLFETAYTQSPYRFTIIGYPDIFNELKREDIVRYYTDNYSPNNMFYVVVGDIDAREVEAQIRSNFAHAKFKAPPPNLLSEEPPQTAAREVIEEASIQLGHVHCSWHMPDLRHPDVPVLDVLALLLGGGRSSRLFQEVRERQGLVNSVDAWTYSPGRPGLFGLSAVCEAEKFPAARAAMLAEVERLKEGLVTNEELTKAIKQFTAATLASRKTMQGQAQDLGGSWIAATDLNFSARYLERVRRTTPAELQRVARQYLTSENRTLYALLPTGTAPQVTLHREEASDHPIQKFEFSNGLRLLVKEDHRLPFVEFRAVFRGGVVEETPANNGVTQMLSRLLLQGTTRRSSEQIANEIESLGGSIDTYGGNNSFGLSAEVLSEDFATGLDLMADVLLNPAFPAEALERERQILLAQIKGRQDHLLQSAGLLMRQAIYGPRSYGLDALGSEASVQRLSLELLRKHHQHWVTPNNCVLAIFGDVKAEAARAGVEQFLATWQSASLPAKPTHPAILSGTPRVVQTSDKKQAVLLIGFCGVDLHHPDRYALELLQEACSDMGSRLFTRIRENLGLAYYVGAQNLVGLEPGYFAFYVGTAGEKVALVESELLEEARLLREEGLTMEELNRSKAKVIGHKKIARQDLGGFAQTIALDELYGLGFANSDTEDARYEAVSLEEIITVARRYLTPDRLVIAIIHPAEAHPPA